MELLKSGKSILYSVSLPEGLTVKQMFHRLADDPVLVGDLPAELPPEGSLKPDTYKFTRGTDRNEIVKQMTAAQKALVQQIWEKRDPDLPVSTIEEFVTLRRSWRRRPAARTSDRGSLRCSSIAWKKA